MKTKPTVVKADDGRYYRNEDTYWSSEPTSEDHGVLMPKPGAKEVDRHGEPLDFDPCDEMTAVGYGLGYMQGRGAS